MGYRFHKKDGQPFYVQLSTASVLRSIAVMYGLAGAMPNPEDHGGNFTSGDRDTLIDALREQAGVLQELADYMEKAEDLRWRH